MKLVACPQCHAQYDVSGEARESFACRCGETVQNRDLSPVDATIRRCGSCGAIVSDDAERCEYCTSEIVRDARSGRLICPECYARNEDQGRFCTACGVGFDPEPIPDEKIELPCPCCGCLMQARSLDGMSICECPRCHGIWAPEGRFESLVRRAIDSHRQRRDALAVPAPRVTGATPTLSVVYRKCPVCEAHMHRSNFRKRSGVIIDVCHAHGTWLDADELEQIAGFITSGGLASAEAAEAERADSERRREAVRAAQAVQAPLSGPPERGVLTSVVELFQLLLT